MSIGSRLRGGFLVMAALMLLCGAAGVFGVARLSSSLAYVTGPAWNAADGAMETQIGLEAQMIAVDRVLADAGHDEANRTRLAEAIEFTRPAYERCLGSGLFSSADVTEVGGLMKEYEATREALLAELQRYRGVREALAEDLERFQAVMTLAEELGDQQVEQLEASPDLALSWSSGLDARWNAADGAMETQISLLERAFYAERVWSERGGDRTEAELARSLLRLNEKGALIAGLPVFAGRIPGDPTGLTFSQFLRLALPRHEAAMTEALAGHRALVRVRDQYRAIVQRLLAALVRFEEEGDSKVEGELGRLTETRTLAFGAMAAAILVSLVFAVAVSVSVPTAITRRVESLRAGIERVARGSLAGDFRSQPGDDAQDELRLIQDDMRTLVGVLEAFVRAARDTSRRLGEASAAVNSSVAELSAGHVQQVSAVTETVATLDQLRASAVTGRDRARAVLEHARRSEEVSRTGSEAVTEVTAVMSQIRERVQTIATTILQLNERSQRIGEIVEAVTAIADQSKLLALNAAIEAAKAGEYGRGFGVVAAEVKELAERSQTATGEIRAILREIQRAANTSVMATEEGAKAADGGLAQVKRAQAAIDALLGTIDVTSRSVQEIAHSVDQQTTSVEQIGGAMREVQVAVEQGSVGARTIQENMAGLTGHVEALAEVVSRFQDAGS